MTRDSFSSILQNLYLYTMVIITLRGRILVSLRFDIYHFDKVTCKAGYKVINLTHIGMDYLNK